MVEVKSFEAPPKAVREQTALARQDAFKKQRTMLRYTLAAIIPASIAVLVAAGSVVYLSTTEQNNYYSVERTEGGALRYVRLNSQELPHGAYIELVENWIKDLRVVTIDGGYNEIKRINAVKKMHLPDDEALDIKDRLFSQLPPQTKESTWVVQIYDIGVTPVSVSQDIQNLDEESGKPAPLARQWRVDWKEDTQNLSIPGDGLKVETRNWMADVITRERDPSEFNPSGLVFEPIVIREVRK